MSNEHPEPQKRLWSRMIKCWDEGLAACRYHLAQRYTAEYPDDQYGWMVLADALCEFARHDEGREALRKAESLAPDTILHEVHCQVGHLYRDKGDHDQAETHYRAALELDESCSHLIFMGACLARQGKMAEAKTYYLRAAAKTDGHPDEAHLNLGYILRAEERYEEALTQFQKALTIDPDYDEAIDARRDIKRLLEMLREET